VVSDREDLGSRSENGSLIPRGKKKDMINTAGENVYAVEVESKLAEHPDVSGVHSPWSASHQIR